MKDTNNDDDNKNDNNNKDDNIGIVIDKDLQLLGLEMSAYCTTFSSVIVCPLCDGLSITM